MFRPKTHSPLLLPAMILAAALTGGGATMAAETNTAGARIYQKRCASCHGKTGQGVKGEYSKPLMGEMYIPQLTRFIEKEMPEDNLQRFFWPFGPFLWLVWPVHLLY